MPDTSDYAALGSGSPWQAQPILVVYASVTGTAESVALRLGRELRAQGFRARVQDVAGFEIVSSQSGEIMLASVGYWAD